MLRLEKAVIDTSTANGTKRPKAFIAITITGQEIAMLRAARRPRDTERLGTVGAIKCLLLRVVKIVPFPASSQSPGPFAFFRNLVVELDIDSSIHQIERHAAMPQAW